ncbi:ATP-dependent helicase [Mycoplasmoides pneumoniae]|uniref:ATP-dependent helicase n=1 Tax=Mycoplasmoides pneumoniae TaxID=2104 RepID=UPI001330D3DC|nr:ATP-dependent helicase [Mycoplasmoides pneumoniae]
MEHLNQEQKAAVTCDNGVNVVYSGAGTGKTTVIAERFAYLVNEKGVNPQSILAFTFTDKAASEMRQRIIKLIPQKSLQDLHIYTFHSFANRFLQKHGKSDFAILSDSNRFFSDYEMGDQLQTVVEIYKNKVVDLELDNLEYNSAFRDACTDTFNEDFSTISNGQFRKRAATALRAYQNYLITNNLFDFSDLIIETCHLLKGNSELLQAFTESVHYILVDEFQDTNLAQYELVKLLATTHPNLFLVGDSNQMIYGWRGAVVEIFELLKNDFQTVKEFYTTQNYRSSQAVLAVANDVLTAIARKERKALVLLHSSIDSKAVPVHYKANSLKNQDQWIIYQMKQLHLNNGVPYDQMAVLFRKNKHLDAFSQTVLEDGDLPLAKLNLLTIHAAKGLEFEAVFVYGLVERAFPSLHWDGSDKHKLLEEMKLFYVAITRAKQFLFLVSVSVESFNAYYEPSRFLKLIEKEHLQTQKAAYFKEQLKTQPKPVNLYTETENAENLQKATESKKWIILGAILLIIVIITAVLKLFVEN